MNINFEYPSAKISASSEVFKSEDGEIYTFLFSGGHYVDSDLCVPNTIEGSNYYFYSGDGQISMLEVKNPSLKV
jgi:hypothetical protein